MKTITKKKSENYDSIYEVTYPIRFYFANDDNHKDEFDGIEIGPLDKDVVTDKEIELIDELAIRLKPSGKPYIITEDKKGNCKLHSLDDAKL